MPRRFSQSFLPRSRLARRFAIAWLVAALLGTQAIGFLHTIAHGVGYRPVGAGAAGLGWTGARDGDAHGAAHRTKASLFAAHSCVAFGAATLAAAAPVDFHCCDSGGGASAPCPALRATAPQRYSSPGFLSRAPPATRIA